MNGWATKKLKCLWCSGGQTWSEPNSSATERVSVCQKTLYVFSHSNGKRSTAFVVFVDFEMWKCFVSLWQAQVFTEKSLNFVSQGAGASFVSLKAFRAIRTWLPFEYFSIGMLCNWSWCRANYVLNKRWVCWIVVLVRQMDKNLMPVFKVTVSCIRSREPASIRVWWSKIHLLLVMWWFSEQKGLVSTWWWFYLWVFVDADVSSG